MDLNEYQNLARQTAIYPEAHGLTYTILGLIGEAGEYYENPSIKEKGDNFWYFAQITYELGLPLNMLTTEKFGQSYLAEVATLANIYKKVIRDDNFHLNGKKRQEIITILASAFHLLWNDGLDNQEAMRINLEKLFGRKERGTLKGSGEDR